MDDVRNAIREVIKAGVELAITRCDLAPNGDPEDFDMFDVAEDAANAAFGIDTCADEPVPEVAELLRRLDAPKVAPDLETVAKLIYNAFNVDVDPALANWDDDVSESSRELFGNVARKVIDYLGRLDAPAVSQEPEREKNRIRSMAWAFYQVLGTFYGSIDGPARIMNWFWDVAHGEDREVSEIFPITPEERAKYEWHGLDAPAGRFILPDEMMGGPVPAGPPTKENSDV